MEDIDAADISVGCLVLSVCSLDEISDSTNYIRDGLTMNKQIVDNNRDICLLALFLACLSAFLLCH